MKTNSFEKSIGSKAGAKCLRGYQLFGESSRTGG